MRLFLLLALFSFSAFARQWSDLEAYSTYTLEQSFELKQKERSGSRLVFEKGTKLRMFQKTGALNLILFKFTYMNCPGNEMETEMELIPVEKSGVEVGIVGNTGCELWFYIDGREYWTESLFK